MPDPPREANQFRVEVWNRVLLQTSRSIWLRMA
jgi:hypothetical protein